jgi:hypothetical protein
MSGKPCSLWSRHRVPASLAALAGTILAALLYAAPSRGLPTALLSPQAIAGVLEDGQLTLTVNLPPAAGAPVRGTLSVELLDGKGNVLGEDSWGVRLGAQAAGPVFRFEAPKTADGMRVRCRFGEESVVVPLSGVLLIKGHETAVSCGQEFFPGSKAAFRCAVHGVRSAAARIPLAGAAVRVRLLGADGKHWPLFQGKTDLEGVAAGQLQIPDVHAGKYKLEVTTASALGTQRLRHEATVQPASRVWLTTDKPLYQPGQRMHLRALALRDFDLRPAANRELTFEIEDARGNKVFKRSLKTSAHGIASADFDLASAVNAGAYRIRALLEGRATEKAVTVKPYVLPKFKCELTTDKKFYLPKETLRFDVQADYLFGKPVAGARIRVTASIADPPLRPFHTWEGTSDGHGHAVDEFSLSKTGLNERRMNGDNAVRLDVEVTDSAGHRETASRTIPLAARPIRVSFIPEGGRVAPEMVNHGWIAATYPDGSPARCDVRVWVGGPRIANAARGKPLFEAKTNTAGLAEFTLTPKAKDLHPDWQTARGIERVGGPPPRFGPPQLMVDLAGDARDARGNESWWVASLASEPAGENVRLRLDRALCKSGERLQIEVQSTAGLPAASLEVVKSGQVVLRKSLDIKDGKAGLPLELPAELCGTLEIYASQVLATGEIIRDGRVVYVQPSAELKVEARADKAEYRPGEKGVIRFEVTDGGGKPAPAALGVLVVDEAVYALQDVQPGLEKVFFTLDRDRGQQKGDGAFKPDQSLEDVVREPAPSVEQRQVAEVLLAAVQPKLPVQWETDPVLERRLKLDKQIQKIGYTLYAYARSGEPFLAQDDKTRKWDFKPGLLNVLTEQKVPNPNPLDDRRMVQLLSPEDLLLPTGERLTLEGLARWEKGFTAAGLARVLTLERMDTLAWELLPHAQAHEKQWRKKDGWAFPEGALRQAVRAQGLPAVHLEDAWGQEMRLVRLGAKREHPRFDEMFDYYDLVSAGPDGKFGTADDVRSSSAPIRWWCADKFWWLTDENPLLRGNTDNQRREEWLGLVQPVLGWQVMGNLGGGGGAIGFGGGMMGIAGLGGLGGMGVAGMGGGIGPVAVARPAPAAAPAAPPARLRESFPETLLWKPALITDDRGVAEMPLPFADSITTWRLSATASSTSGLLGGTTKPLRVFQDFFVDLDLPVALTRNDEVAFPVAVYNYLKEPQKVQIDLQPADWFELTDREGPRRLLALRPNEVTSVSFRVRATKVGHFPLTVQARGTKMSDAVRRFVEVAPDGEAVEQVFSDRLSGKVTNAVVFPKSAIPGASRLFVKVCPGVLSQALDGAEEILRLPHGCFEQTSSSVYPNLLVLDYLRKSGRGSPEVLRKAESYLNQGYQRLLTFERPGGGFDWWGKDPPVLWLTALGLHEFTDMARVHPIDTRVIDRTRAWLLKQQGADGSWSEDARDSKTLLTAYVAWAMLESGVRGREVDNALAYLRAHVEEAGSAYVLALTANALAAADPKDPTLAKVLQQLDRGKKDLPEWKASCFPSAGRSLTYARGNSLTVETTALAVLALVKSGQYAETANRALVYLVKSRDPHGTWATTQATILALKALAASAGSGKQQGTTAFTILVNGQEAHKGEVNEQNADAMQQFDLTPQLRTGRNEVTLEAGDKSALTCQVVGRHFEPWKDRPAPPGLYELGVDYGRTKLTVKDVLEAKATLKYRGAEPAAMVVVELGVPPGFALDEKEFAGMVSTKKVEKFAATAGKVTLYLGEVRPNSTQTFAYTLRPKYPLRAKAPPAAAWEYYTPANRATAAAVELTVEDPGK